jgi:hypothetical protein
MTRGLVHEARVGSSDEWYTPADFFNAVLPGVTFDVDVASPGAGLCAVPAQRHITAAEDGLKTPWEGFAWCNPPYSNTAAWAARMVAHGNGMTLTFNRTDTRWGQRLLANATAVLFLRHRIRFVRPDGTSPGSPGAGSMLCLFGPFAVAAARHAVGVHGVQR